MFLSVDDPGASKVEGVADAGDLDHPGGASPKNGSVHRAPFGVSPAGISRVAGVAARVGCFGERVLASANLSTRYPC
jgi:hypothetical protein